MEQSRKVRIKSAGIEFTSAVQETILSAALRQGHNLPHGCQNGGCGQCTATLISGECYHGGELATARDGEILTCQAIAGTDIELELGSTRELMALSVKTLPAKVDRLDFLSEGIARIVLRYPPRENFDYLPGQFLNLHWNGLSRSYSIASHSSDAKKIELHISYVNNGRFTGHVFGGMKVGDLLRLEGPMGGFYVRQGLKPLIFVAGGTGFAPVQAMVEQLIDRVDKREIFIYWSNSSVSDFYSPLPDEWCRKYSNVTYVPSVSRDSDSWIGRRGRVHQVVLEDFKSLDGFDVYACGSPNMVDAARTSFYAHGLSPDSFYADPFTLSS